ncbi:serine hydrolase domain-containing protein [Brevibacillus choshinensis]|uniref:serine hydrolase domain-containing protein n=1 Tax=Brevibacillus choshinensis TaxID=54911 RepID=UPI0006EBF6AC|nr:serine hydrolase domain-containing protein [Brevibacillus choshinensis]
MQNSIYKMMHSYTKEAYERGFFNGCILLAHKNDILFETALGIANMAKKTELNLDSVFELASVSKQFTASAIILLNDKGVLSLNDDLEKYFPGIPYKGRTIKNLLNHTTGIPDYEKWVIKQAEQTGTIPKNDVIEKFLIESNLPEEFAVGTKWSYSNTGYAALALIIEKASGMPFGTFLEKEFFQPAKMSSTCVYHRRLNGDTIPNYAYGYIFENGEYILPDDSQSSQFVIPLDGIEGDGIVNSNLHDMLKWSLVLKEGKIISHASQQEMYTPTYVNGESVPYGYGWRLFNNEKAGYGVRHAGGWPGYHTHFIRYIDKEMTLVLLMNLSGDIWGRRTFLEGVESIVEGRMPQPITPTDELIDLDFDKSKYLALCGNYEGDISVSLKENSLFASFNTREQTETHEILPAKYGRFITRTGFSFKFGGSMITLTNAGGGESKHKKIED